MNPDFKQIFKTDEGNANWKQFLNNAHNTSYLSTMEFAYSRESEGRNAESFLVSSNGEDLAGVHYSRKKNIRNLVTVSDTKSGLVFKEGPDPEIFESILDHYLNWASANHVAYARINTWIPKTIAGQEMEYSALFEKALSKKGFRQISEPKNTYWIDLTKSEEQLLSQMKSQTRYRVNQGLRSDIKAVITDIADTEHIDGFWEIYRTIGEKKQFSMYTEMKFKNEVNNLLNAGLANLFLLKFEDTIVNYSLASNYGISFYLHGAINHDFKKLKGCPSPGQLAQWTMISFMKKKGLKLYDLGFCPGPVPYPEHPRYPIWSFKYGFGGIPVEYLPVYGKVIQPVRGRIFHFLYKKR